LRMLLGNIGMFVHPNQQAIGGVAKLVNDEGEVSDAATLKKLHSLGEQAVSFTKAMTAGK
jgi:chromate reductase